jgi:uncharacterized protein (TIGR00730 family)
MEKLERICVFCGSQMGNREEYAEAARKLAAELVKRKISLVYGGACIGLMGTIADAVLNAGGEVTGVIPEALLTKEVAHNGLTKLHVVKSMHERKALMAELSDAFIALPGGFGTFEEFCEVVTWTQLGIHPKACGLLNVADYYSPLIKMFDQATEEKFIRPVHRNIVLADPEPIILLDKIEAYEPPVRTKWLERDET